MIEAVGSSLTNATPADWRESIQRAIARLRQASEFYEESGQEYVKRAREYAEAKTRYEDAWARAHLANRMSKEKLTVEAIKQLCVLATTKERETMNIAHVLKEAASTARESLHVDWKAAFAEVEALRGIGFLLQAEAKVV